MKLRCSATFFSLLVCATIGHVQQAASVQKIPVGRRAELFKDFPSLKNLEEVAVGDVNGDGIEDVAAVVQYLESGAERNRIVVLFGGTSGCFVLNSHSASWAPHMRRMESIEIKRNSIRISASTTSYTDYEGTPNVSSIRDGDFMLIGLDREVGKIGDDLPDKTGVSFLTNKVIESRMIKQVRSNFHRKLNGNYRTPLQKFSLEDGVDMGSLR